MTASRWLLALAVVPWMVLLVFQVGAVLGLATAVSEGLGGCLEQRTAGTAAMAWAAVSPLPTGVLLVLATRQRGPRRGSAVAAAVLLGFGLLAFAAGYGEQACDAATLELDDAEAPVISTSLSQLALIALVLLSLPTLVAALRGSPRSARSELMS